MGVFFVNKHSAFQEMQFPVSSLVVFSIQACVGPV